MPEDRFGVEVAGDPATAPIWDEAFGQLLAYQGDPLSALANANDHDDGFTLGPAFCAAYRLLGGAGPDTADIVTNLARARARAEQPRELAAADAVELMAAGQWSQAADRLDTHVVHEPRDLFAQKLSHDLRLHSGGLARHVDRVIAAGAGWHDDEPGYGYNAGMRCFSLEEAGDYDEARRWGERALEINPGDAWARHSMAHVCESVADEAGFASVITDAGAEWHDRTLFANHLWWHQALRSWNRGDVEATFALSDAMLTSTTAFGLCDSTSLVWRAALAGHDMTTRWATLALAWDANADVHHAAFVDVHAAVVFAAVPGAAADRFWASLDERLARPAKTENDRTFAEVVRPFAAVVRSWRRDGGHRLGPDAHQALTDKLWHVGGSVIQRQVMRDTLSTIGASTIGASSIGASSIGALP